MFAPINPSPLKEKHTLMNVNLITSRLENGILYKILVMQLLKIVYIELNLVNSNTDILIPTNLSNAITYR